LRPRTVMEEPMERSVEVLATILFAILGLSHILHGIYAG